MTKTVSLLQSALKYEVIKMPKVVSLFDIEKDRILKNLLYSGIEVSTMDEARAAIAKEMSLLRASSSKKVITELPADIDKIMQGFKIAMQDGESLIRFPIGAEGYCRYLRRGNRGVAAEVSKMFVSKDTIFTGNGWYNNYSDESFSISLDFGTYGLAIEYADSGEGIKNKNAFIGYVLTNGELYAKILEVPEK